jgi:hypothetical protein
VRPRPAARGAHGFGVQVQRHLGLLPERRECVTLPMAIEYRDSGQRYSCCRGTLLIIPLQSYIHLLTTSGVES